VNATELRTGRLRHTWAIAILLAPEDKCER
jgi:hypothetical protein